jgi:hypothetical protein
MHNPTINALAIDSFHGRVNCIFRLDMHEEGKRCKPHVQTIAFIRRICLPDDELAFALIYLSVLWVIFQI